MNLMRADRLRLDRWLAALPLAAMLVVGGCEDQPTATDRPENPTLSGTSTYDQTVEPGDVSAKGLSGPLRTSANSSGTNQYTVDVSQLKAPYILKYSGGDKAGNSQVLFTVALQPGVANIDPLTTLLVAQLFGQDPTASFNGFAAVGAGLNSTQLSQAQAKISQYLQDVLGVAIVPPSGDWITSPFKAAKGDATFDSIANIESQLTVKKLTFFQLTSQIATAAGFCLKEDVAVNAAGVKKDFCPASKSATPQDVDHPDILTYQFTSALNEILTIKVNGSTVTSGAYTASDGTVYSCQTTGCVGIAASALAADGTRVFTLTQATLDAKAAKAVLNGSLTGAVPNVVLPVLPCNDNKFYLILPDRTVQAACVPPTDPLSLGGTLSATVGAVPSRATYAFYDVNGTANAYTQVDLTMDADNNVVQVFAYTYDPNTGTASDQFYCQLADCANITLGPVTVNTDLGPDNPVEIRTISFADTPMAGLDESGPTGLTAKLEGSFVMVYYVDPNNPLLFPALADCMAGSITLTLNAGSNSFNFCSAAANRGAYTLTGGGLNFSLVDDSYYSPINVFTDASGKVTHASYSSTVSETYMCLNDCSGITVSAPAPDGSRTVTFDGAVLHEALYIEPTFYLKGPRTMTLNGPSVSFPAPLPPNPMALARTKMLLKTTPRPLGPPFPPAGSSRIRR
jgi:hypothetical protein